jgi:hypothetical protein
LEVGPGMKLPYVFRLIYRRYMQKMIAFKKIGTSSLAEDAVQNIQQRPPMRKWICRRGLI